MPEDLKLDEEPFPASDPIALTDPQMDALVELSWVRDEMRDLKKREDQLKAEIKDFLDGATEGLDPDGKAAVKVKVLERTGVDSKKLEAMFPDVFENVRTTTTYSRIDLDV